MSPFSVTSVSIGSEWVEAGVKDGGDAPLPVWRVVDFARDAGERYASSDVPFFYLVGPGGASRTVASMEFVRDYQPAPSPAAKP